MKKILLGINILTQVDSQVYANHLAWMYHLGRLGERGDYGIILYTPWRLSIDRMRNSAAKLALQNDCDYLMFVDDDMVLTLNTVESLIAADRDIVMAHTYIRGYPFPPMSFTNVSDVPNDIRLKHFTDYKEHIDKNGIADCDAVGFATVLIKTEILKKLETPYFITSPYSTEDIYFCLKCKMELENVSIAIDTKCPTGHALDKEFVHSDTVEALRLFKELLDPAVDVENIRGDRGTEYHNLVKDL